METAIKDKIVKSLTEEEATSPKFNEFIPSCDFLIFYDHGVEDGLIAQPDVMGGPASYLIHKSEAHKLKNKSVYTMACLSAKELGIEAYKEGCKEYWGAVEAIGFVPAEGHLFEEIYNMGVYQRFYEERTIEEVLANMKRKFNENIYLARNPWSRVWLRKDRDSWRCWSDQTPPTEEDTECFFRKLVVKCFGKRGWKFPSFRSILNRLFS